jgi:hypothetical protein
MFFVKDLFGNFINFLGASLRWIIGSISAKISSKPKFTFKEYLYGPTNSNDYYDKNGHRFNNIWIGLIVFFFIFYVIERIIKIY